MIVVKALGSTVFSSLQAKPSAKAVGCPKHREDSQFGSNALGFPPAMNFPVHAPGSSLRYISIGRGADHRGLKWLPKGFGQFL
jgi:hypothetical protein